MESYWNKSGIGILSLIDLGLMSFNEMSLIENLKIYPSNSLG